jgi:hypothetical protein
MPEAAICVQDIDVQCVLQFTLILAAGCALHRHTSRVIHRLELYTSFVDPSKGTRRSIAPPGKAADLCDVARHHRSPCTFYSRQCRRQQKRAQAHAWAIDGRAVDSLSLAIGLLHPVEAERQSTRIGTRGGAYAR